VNAIKHINGKIEGWTPSYTIKESMKKRQVSLQEVLNVEVLTFSTSIGNITINTMSKFDVIVTVLGFIVVIKINLKS
jgi:hypothetical protein